VSGPRLIDAGPRDLRPHLGGAAVDPRFRARRIAVRKEAGRRRLRRLLVLVAVALVAIAAVLVVRSPVLDVDEISVVGAAHTPADEIRVASGIDAGDPVLLADLGAARAAIESLPWVAEAEVTRDLPGRVHVAVREREPVAVVSGAGRAVLVDEGGRVLADASVAEGPPYVQVVAPLAPPEAGRAVARELRTAIELAGRLRSNPAGAVAAVHVEPGLRLQLAEGGVVELGDATQLDAKVEAFRTVHARVDRGCLAVLDLTVPSHPVLTRDPC
jgi:cell division protein FtsQ